MSWYAFLGRVVGEGKLAFLSCANFLARGVDQPYDAVELAFDDDVFGHMSVPDTSHRLLLDMLTHVARSVRGCPRGTRAFVVRRWSFLRDSSVDHFRVRLIGVHTEAEISCTTRISLRKRKKADGASEEDALPFGLTLGPVAKRANSSVAPERSGGAGIAPGDALESDEDSARDLEVARSWSSEAGSEPEDSIVVESSAHSNAVEDEPWNAMGVKAWGIAPPRARAMCCVCNLKIVAGLVRIDYGEQRFEGPEALSCWLHRHGLDCDAQSRQTCRAPMVARRRVGAARQRRPRRGCVRVVVVTHCTECDVQSKSAHKR